MTCAACAARIDKALNKLDGVEASVNYATEQAAVRYDDRAVAVDDLVQAVEGAGYHASLDAERGARRGRAWGCASAVAAALTVPLALMAMVPPLGFEGWEWVALALATPVWAWAGWPFHRAALKSARHGAATMDTLISLGTTAAYAWSVVALLALDDAEVYFEVTAVVTTLILLGRWLEARARRRSGAALRALLELGREGGASSPRRRRGGHRPRGARRRRPLRRPPGREARHRRRGGRGALSRRPVDADRRARSRGRGPGRRGRRRHRQRLRPAGRPRHPRRLGHGPGPDRAARRRRAGRQGADPAAGRPRLGRLRADRDRALAGDACGLAPARRHRHRGLHRRRRRSHHRVPVRAGPRHADGAAGRNRPRRAARDRDQGPRGARADEARLDHRPRQDRHRHRGTDGARRRGRR